VGLLAFSRAAAPADETPESEVSSMATPPRLILQITVDQLRGDLPRRYAKHMGKGGFAYLMNQGIWYADAHHAHTNTETVVGHSTLATENCASSAFPTCLAQANSARSQFTL
jgi:hypothetical protein